MKLILLSLFAGVFSIDTSKIKSETTIEKIFITSTDSESGRTLMIEEDEYSIWAYVLKPNMEGIDFDGFLCSIIDPKSMEIDPKEATKNGNATPLTATYANKHSYIKSLSAKDIKIYWKKDRIEIKLKKEIYLIMDLKTKTSYSKALAKDCYYGNKL
ncbi:hypothetical protein [Aquimarina sp. RZ0]|uniref:hypothetical protein n=1 Tax=Aquimarina sp. RZ0 TaxID=2607730 RepID=UPI0011F2F7FC|nr:hypothetical protein [Aquimarina sp. RZ0]KAA1247877.1 hypothetical protein F0000_01275 [Aquimarina sp. RZ0]